jgi:maleate isomerase
LTVTDANPLIPVPTEIRFDAGNHALARDRADADAIFVSSGALRTLEVIAEFEACAGKPSICSNQVMIRDCRRLAGIDDRFAGYGRLLPEF